MVDFSILTTFSTYYEDVWGYTKWILFYFGPLIMIVMALEYVESFINMTKETIFQVEKKEED